jgi:hypothetical protein
MGFELAIDKWLAKNIMAPHLSTDEKSASFHENAKNVNNSRKFAWKSCLLPSFPHCCYVADYFALPINKMNIKITFDNFSIMNTIFK